jgi:hypothetical protein
VVAMAEIGRTNHHHHQRVIECCGDLWVFHLQQ